MADKSNTSYGIGAPSPFKGTRPPHVSVPLHDHTYKPNHGWAPHRSDHPHSHHHGNPHENNVVADIPTLGNEATDKM